jgi:hypothetical protein
MESFKPYIFGERRTKCTEQIVLVKKIAVRMPPMQKTGFIAKAPIFEMKLRNDLAVGEMRNRVEGEAYAT